MRLILDTHRYIKRHKWFAWYPVRATSEYGRYRDFVWLETVWRSHTSGYLKYWQYQQVDE